MRITPEIVKQAYEETGLYPISDAFWEHIEDKCWGACPVAVLGYRVDPVSVSPAEGYDESEPFAELLGMPETYLAGFIYGYDSGALHNDTADMDENELFMSGFRDGITVRESLDSEETTA